MPRKDHLRRLQFSPSERELYDNIRTRTRDAFPELLNPHAATKANYFDSLAWIDKLRKICNHDHISKRVPLPPVRSPSPHFHNLWSDATELPGSGSKTVDVEESSGTDLPDPVSQYLQEIASENSGKGSPPSITSNIVATPMSQDHLEVETNRGNSELDSPKGSGCSSPDTFAITTACVATPTKIQRLMCDLTDNEADQKRCGVPKALPRCRLVN